MAEPLILALDQGTTSHPRHPVRRRRHGPGQAGRPLAQHYPDDGWVEHDADEIFAGLGRRCCARRSRRPAGSMADVTAIGVTNQRETVVVWEKATGKPIHRAIVWQDRRTAATCERAARRAGKGRRSPRSPACCWTLLLGDQARLAAGAVRGRARARPGRRAAGRHHRHLGDLEADRRQGARHRRHQRLPHPAATTSKARPGRPKCGDDAGGARSGSCREVLRLRRRLRRDRRRRCWAARSRSAAWRATSRRR